MLKLLKHLAGDTKTQNILSKLGKIKFIKKVLYILVNIEEKKLTKIHI